MALTKITFSMIDGSVFNVKDYGAVGNGIADDTTAIKDALLAAVGGILLFEADKIYKVTDTLIQSDNISINLNGSKIKFVVTGDTRCLQMQNNTSICNGEIELAGSSYSGSGDSGCPILIGRWENIGYENIVVDNIKITTNRDVGNGILILSDSNNIRLSNLVFGPDVYMGCPIQAHWGGSAGTGTTHPYNITVENVRCESLTRAITNGLSCIFLSAAYNVTVDNVLIDNCPGYHGVDVFIGDLGFTYASADVKLHACTGIRINNVTATDVFVFASVTMKDVYGGATLWPSQISFSNCYATTDSTSNSSAYGFYINQVDGLTITNTKIYKFYDGIFLQDTVKNLKISGCVVTDCHLRSVFFTNSGTPVGTNIWIDSNIFAYSNASSSAGECDIQLFGVSNSTISNNVFNSFRAARNIRLDNTDTSISVINNISQSVDSAAGPAFSFGDLTDVNIVDEFHGNLVVNVPTGGIKGGQAFLPFAVAVGGPGAAYQQKFMTMNSAPSAGAWNKGDIVFNSAPTSGGFIGWVCTTAGTPGTWKTFGVIS